MVHQSGLGPDTYTDIYLGGYIRSDFADLRFTSPDQTTLLSHWIESIVSGVATVWIKIPTLVPINNIYIYYNNPISSDISNPNTTFDLYEDFSGTSLNTTIWGTGSGGGSYSYNVSDGNLNITGSTYLHSAGSYNIVSNNYIPILGREITYRGLTTSLNGGTYEEYVEAFAICATRDPTNNFGYFVYGDILTNLSNGLCIFIMQSRHGNKTFLNIYKKINGTGGYIYSETLYSPAVTTDDTFIVKLIDANNLIVLRNGIEIINIDNLGLNFSNGYIYLSNGDSASAANTVKFDYVKIRKYTPPEPTFGVSGNEELNVTATDIALDKTSCLVPCSINAYVTWYNYGNADITSFTTAVEIDGITLSYGAPISIPAGGSASSGAISTPILSIGSHTICPYPN